MLCFATGSEPMIGGVVVLYINRLSPDPRSMGVKIKGVKYKVLCYWDPVVQRGLAVIIAKHTTDAFAWMVKNLLRGCGLKKACLYKRTNLVPALFMYMTNIDIIHCIMCIETMLFVSFIVVDSRLLNTSQ